MTDHTFRDATEYLRLLRGASRSKTLLFLAAFILTWGLWATLRAGEERLPAVHDKCTQNLKEWKAKTGLPPDIAIELNSTDADVFQALENLQKSGGPTIAPSQWNQIALALETEQNRCQQLTTAAYVVKVRVPYLAEAISIDGLALADSWPFVMVAIAAAILVFQLRERTNAIVLSWLAINTPDSSARQLINIRSNYRIGELGEKSLKGEKIFVYHTPLLVRPESLLVYTLLSLTIYYSLFLEATHRIELSHEMQSVLFDYLAGLWFYAVVMVYLIRRTWRYYRADLERLVGRPIFGRTHLRFAKPSAFLDVPLSPTESWIVRTMGSKVVDILFSLIALGLLFLPWMKGTPFRGYQILLGTSGFDQVDENLAGEFQFQLALAVIFVLSCLFLALICRFVSARKKQLLTKWARRLGIAVELLIGNLLFHILVLRIIFGSVPSPFTYLKNMPLLLTNPALGFLLFVCIVFWLTERLTISDEPEEVSQRSFLFEERR